MSAFTTCAAPRAVAPDPTKRVNYAHGLVLGAAEYLQESTYLSGRVEELARDLLGYGTISGLGVSVTMTPQRGPALVVASGVALSPQGRPIRLPLACAVHLNDWLEAERGAFIPHLQPGADSPPNDRLTAYVTARYCACVTDGVPGPGQPCRTDEPPAQFTRIADSARLDLVYRPPDQVEEDAVGDFIAWLRGVEITASELDALTLDEFLDALRGASALASPPEGSLTSPPGALLVPAARAAEFFDAAFRVWTSEIRRLWRSGASGAASCDGSSDDAVLLAEVSLPLVPRADGRWVVDETAPIEIREDRRPYLLHLRLLQEWVISRDRVATGGARLSAAGVVRGEVNDASHRQPLVNGLRVIAVADGEVTIAFAGYAPPPVQGPFQFVVKAQSHARPAPAVPALVGVSGFGPDGIALRVVDAAGTAIPVADLAALEIAIEVTRYGA